MKEIGEAQEHIQTLLKENKIAELNQYLDGYLTQKYWKEKIAHNLVHPELPKTTSENANNAIDFLEQLKKAKAIKLGTRFFAE